MKYSKVGLKYIAMISNKLNKDNRLIMAQIAVDFSEIGIKNFPRDYIAEYCPKTDPLEIHNWFMEARDVWNLRNSNKKIIEVFEKAFIDAKEEFEVPAEVESGLKDS